MEALTHAGYQNVIADGNTVTPGRPGSGSSDLGGIAKGYIADQLESLSEKEGVKHADQPRRQHSVVGRKRRME